MNRKHYREKRAATSRMSVATVSSLVGAPLDLGMVVTVCSTEPEDGPFAQSKTAPAHDIPSTDAKTRRTEH